ncbi:MAG: ROK family protein [Actinomycetes bacterium]
MDRQERDNQQGGTPRLLRAINTRALLEALRRAGPSSRPQLARLAGLSKPTVSQALGDLETAGLVRLVGPASPSVGRTAMLYEVDPTAGYVVGIDIGRAWIRIAAADLSGEIVARRDERNRERSATALVRTVSAVAHDVVAAAGLTWDQVVHTVVGGPGVFDPESDRLLHAPNLPGWSRPGLMTSLREALPPSVALDNDANLAAVGERSYGSGRDARTFVYVSVGTGIGMGIIIDGSLYRGAHGAAGEVGYLPIGADPYDRQVRRRGAFEESVNGAAVVRRATEAGMGGSLSAKKVFALAAKGDPLARGVVEDEARRLALGLAVVTAVVDLELVILGGGVGGNAELLLSPIERELRTLSPIRPRLAVSALGEDAVLQGAVATALAVAQSRLFDPATMLDRKELVV